jgi:DNA-binding MarR family transcriptional regulator
MAGTEKESLDDLPPSAKLVFKVLEYNGPLTQKGIVEESMLSARTVRYALERLEGIGCVDEDVYFADARQNLYRLTSEDESEADRLAAQAQADGGVTSSQREQEESTGPCTAGCD